MWREETYTFLVDTLYHQIYRFTKTTSNPSKNVDLHYETLGYCMRTLTWHSWINYMDQCITK